MLHTHHRAVARIGSDRDLKYLIRDYFRLPRATSLMPALLAKGLGQADLVLCLLRLRDAHAALRSASEAAIARLVGRPISVGQPCLLGRFAASRVPLDRTPRVAYVVPDNPRQTNTEAYLRWPEYRVGRSTAQLRARDVRPKDIRLAVRRGWIKLEENA